MRAIRYQDHRDDHLQLMQRGKYHEAFAMLQEMAPMHGDDPVYIADLAEAMWYMGDEKQVLDLLHILVTRFPDYYRGWLQLGLRMGSYGETEQAVACFRKALELKPESIAARTELAKHEPFSPNSQQARVLRKYLEDDIADPVKIEILIALANAEARSGSAVKAFHYWTQMNALRKLDYDTEGLLQMVKEIGRLAPAMPRAATDAAMPRFLFITGMPRSGTTITETELAKHPDAHPMGELPTLQIAVQALKLPAFSGLRRDWIAHLHSIDAAQIAQIRAVFLSQLPRNAPRGKVLITKTPADAFSIWAARLIIPELKVLHIERHPLDVALSNFSTNFGTLRGYHTTLDGIADVTRATWQVRDINAGLLGADMRVQSYRAMVEDQENQLAHCLAFAGLAPERMQTEADPETLRAVRTASVHQVRQGVNTKGLEKWRKFERQLAPFVSRLGGPEVIAAWEAQDRARDFRPG
ncbi:tetratricopeptide repeat-containing sulfotransferase family protein [Thioclava kandeliae]|uniref:Sulfotransferase n=1 Tax=Thioclava kandeliae TaxID=3070818 RepID=A0ABV1SF33_9RHOB